jgi:hypothetical protein
MSTETALFQVTHRLEKSLNHRDIAWGAFLYIEGAFDNTSYHVIITAARQRGLEETCCRWADGNKYHYIITTQRDGSH